MTLSESQLERARYIRTVLAWHGVTQSDLARILGCTQQAASKKLAAQSRFTDDELLAIADEFDLDPGNLLRPPALAGILGSVRKSVVDLLTCWLCEVPLVSGLFRLAYPAAA